MQEIKKIKKLSLANIAAFLYAFFAFIITFATFIYLLVKVILEKDMADKLAKYIFINLGLDFLISLGLAVGAGIIGWVIGFCASGFYNFIAGNIGGVKVDLADEVTGQIVALKTEEKKPSFAKATEGKQELFKY